MDFLESAVILIPSLTGMGVRVYSGEMKVLEQFEEQYCFSEGLQRLYTAKGLRDFLEKGAEEIIYEITEPMESHLIIFHTEGAWILLGPYVEEGWKDNSARQLLGRLGISQAHTASYKNYRCQLPISGREQAMRAVMLLLEHTGDGGTGRMVKAVNESRQAPDISLPFSDKYESSSVVNRRYHLEECFIKAVSCGETEKALGILEEIQMVCTDLRFMSADLRDQIVGAGIVRTLTRMGAKMAGMSPVLIDSISQEYAQRMQHTASAEKLSDLTAQLVERFCREVLKEQKEHYSMYVKKAVEYMDINLSRPVTVAELSAAAGINQQQLVKLFIRETGMTMKQYLAKKRSDLAAELLLESRMSVQEIGAYVGYGDNNYFSKVFKANIGVSPKEYRRMYWTAIEK